MTAQAGSAQRALARRRGWSLAFLLSAALHLLVLGWFGLKRAAAEWGAETPAVSVLIVRLSPREPPRPRGAARPATGRLSRAPVDPRTAAPLVTRDGAAGTSAAPGLTIDPRWRVDRKAPVPAPRREPDDNTFQPCDPLKDPRREGKACRKVDEIAEAVTRFYDPRNGRSADAREARRNEAMRRYRDAPGGSGHPGLRCSMLNQC